MSTVDSHVIKTLPIELSEAAALPASQQSVIIGHFLGVDHIGHRFGIEHPEMRRKVADMVSRRLSVTPVSARSLPSFECLSAHVEYVHKEHVCVLFQCVDIEH